MITSLYSYKGGVGRTQLAANLASHLCFREGKKVLLIDWDLEAPGLHYYFKKEKLQNKGLIELLKKAVEKMKQEFTVSEDDLPFIDKSYVVRVVRPLKSTGCIDLVPAGFYDENLKEYNQKINSFNWREFYDKYDGATYFEIFKLKLKGLGYDYIFIDSRTGVSDYSGIVNIQIPDLNILIAAPSLQNIKGVVSVAENIKNSPYVKQGYRKPLIMPILSRIDLSIETASQQWIELYQENFNLFISEFCDYTLMNSNRYINDTLLDYKRDISYGENILFDEKNTRERGKTLSKQYSEISKVVQNVKYILSRNSSNNSVQKNKTKGEKRRIFISYAHKDIEYYEIFAQKLRVALHFSDKYEWELRDDKDIQLGANWHKAMQSTINEADVVILLLSNAFLNSNYIEENVVGKMMKTQKVIPIKISPVNSDTWSNLSKIQGWNPSGNMYGLGNITDFTFADLVKFDKYTGKSNLNSNIDRYMGDFVKALENSQKRRRIR